MKIGKTHYRDDFGRIMPTAEYLLKQQDKKDNAFKIRRKKTNKYASTHWMNTHPRDEHGRWVRSGACSVRWKKLRDSYNYKNFKEFLKQKRLNINE
jgi:hypothetical protein